MPATSPTTKLKRKVIPLELKIKILDRLLTGDSITSVGEHFCLHKATIKTIKENEVAIRMSVLSEKESSVSSASNAKNIIKEKMEKALAIWIVDKLQENVGLDENTIRDSALRIYKEIKNKLPCRVNRRNEFNASFGWMTGFLKRYDFNNIKIEGKTARASKLAAKQFSEKLGDNNNKNGENTSDKLWNADKSSLLHDRKSIRMHVAKSRKSTALNTYFNAKHSDSEESDSERSARILSADLLKEGLELIEKFENHFVTHDPNEERSKKFQRGLKLLTASYSELYKSKSTSQSQRLITEFFS